MARLARSLFPFGTRLAERAGSARMSLRVANCITTHHRRADFDRALAQTATP